MYVIFKITQKTVAIYHHKLIYYSYLRDSTGLRVEARIRPGKPFTIVNLFYESIGDQKIKMKMDVRG